MIDGKCYVIKPCPVNFKLENGKCQRYQCSAGFILDGHKCIRRFCPTGYVLINNTCVKEIECKTGFKRIDDKCVRKYCKPGFEYDPIRDICFRKNCEGGFDWNSETKKCEKWVCPDGFIKNTTTNKCDRYYCPDTFTLSGDQKICSKKSCPENFTLDTTTGKCNMSGCPEGYFFNQISWNCQRIYCRDGFLLEMKTSECILIKTIAPEVIVDNSDLNLSDSVHNMMLYFSILDESIKTDIYGCGLNLSDATRRCEAVHGEKNCEVVAPTYVHKRCPVGFSRIGCCSCAKQCPDTFRFIDSGLYCTKDNQYVLKKYTTIEECNKYTIETCQKHDTDSYFAPCIKGFVKSGADLCVAECPTGFNDLGDKCLKPEVTELGTQFAWTNGDN